MTEKDIDINKNKISLIVYDFDGVMTDNTVHVDQNGIESVIVNRSDGYAVARIRDLGITQIILSTEKSPVVVKRAEKLKIPVINGVDDKKTVLCQYCCDNHINLSEVLYVGNDLNDYDAMVCVGYPCCPCDAEIEIKNISIWISSYNGGQGVIRDLLRKLSTNSSKGYFR